ncbi:inositol monophosphatase family protein [Archaeoglobus veneficus]|uniref:fructose-bisphosphatase n=1 Tax=Archaeoglobus veneficus (strain DSM 11195 / SNP6) TaxID=693661 RepID=F2KML9_ARCVS|nr:inositol monophosphatase family protein [Archaeoglobus veneficus]AEA47216.1 Inositol-phosphate phosphatase [Archaeoglobus veneficus SNP6]
MRSSEALEISRHVAEEVRKAVLPIAGSKEAGIEVGMGKDGTPTKRIDRIAEDAALAVLKDYDVRVITEESGVVGDGEVIVALDPVDGTFNAAKGVPIYSVALCFSRGEKIEDTFFGYVINLATGVEYWADEKAYKDGEPITVSDSDSLRCNAIMYYPRREYGFKRIRIFGSAALEICFVADGSFDCFIDIRKGAGKGLLRVYDVAASLFIAKKAGAIVTDDRGNDIGNKRFTMDERFRLVVANEKLHPKLLEVLKGWDSK